jgi:hypothetical protein
MVMIVKSEWHQVEKRYGIDLDESLMAEIYPELDEDEIAEKLSQLESGDLDVDEILDDAWNNDVSIDWDYLDQDDWWTDRKGGYEVTHSVEDWERNEPYVEPITHKCTKCKWEGTRWATATVYLDKDNNVIPDDSDETGENQKDVCPMCDSDVQLTPVGVEKERERQELHDRWEQERLEAMSEKYPCFSCEAMHSENELIEMDGQLQCPSCGEGWIMMDDRPDVDDMAAGLEQLKKEFEELMVSEENEEATEESTKEPTEVLPNYPAGEYTIRIWGRTREIGVGKISKEQYEYWSDEDNEDNLSDALNENFDYDDADTPEEARFEHPYYEYQDVVSFWGFDTDDTHMTITNSDGEEIYEGDLSSFIQEAHGDADTYWESSEEVGELYPEYFEKGYHVFWTQGGKGSCIQTTIDTGEEEFDPRKLKYTHWDVQGYSVTNRLVYDGSELDDEGMDSDKDNWRGQWSEFSVHHNE